MTDPPDAQTTGGVAGAVITLLTGLGLWARKAANEKSELVGKIEKLEKGVEELQAIADLNQSKLNALVSIHQETSKLMAETAITNRSLADLLKQMISDDKSHREAVREKLRDIEHQLQ